MRQNSQNYTLAFDVGAAPEIRPKAIRIAGKWIRTTPVFYSYWRFAAERQDIFFKRLRGDRNRAFTSDPILARYKFTNAYRASDRVSQYLIRNVIYRPDLPNSFTEVFFRTLLFKIFNRIDTWEHLQEHVGAIVLDTFRFETYDELLGQRLKEGRGVYSAAYIMPSAGFMFGHRAKHQNHLRLLEFLIANDFPGRIASCSSMSQAFAVLMSAPSLGPFLAYQYITDLNYTPQLNFEEGEFVVAGPGALDGIHKCFEGASIPDSSDVIRYMQEHQDFHFSEQELKFSDLWGRPLQLIDCQNVFCEISKYARVAYPQYAGASGRTRIKQRFAMAGALPSPWYPPKWGLNNKIAAEPRR